MKKMLALLLAAVMVLSMAACAAAPATTPADTPAPAEDTQTTETTETTETNETTEAPAEETPAAEPENLTATQQIIKEAEGMTLEELAKKAIEESNGKMFYGVGNSSRGKSALPLFIEYLQSIDSSYNMEFEWQQPKNNKIFDQLTADSLKGTGTFAMTLIQDGNQIESKMVQTGILDTFIPKDWADANGTTADAYTGFLPLQTLNKVFMYNCVGDKTYDNCWDFVAEGEHGLFMDIDSEIVGKNFLYMLTRDDYAAWLKESFEALSADEQAYFQPTIAEMESEAADLGLGADGAYALAWIKLWVESYNAQTDDGPICNTLVDASAKDQFGLLVYSKLRSVEESSSVSVNNIKVAAYEDGYQGIGGYGYCHYLFVTDNSPLPWTACAFIAYMTCTADGFSAWGKDMGGYSSNPTVAEETEANFHHSIGGMAEDGTTVEFAAKNDRGYEWWTTNGKLVLEDPEYCADVACTVGSWIEMLSKYSAGLAVTQHLTGAPGCASRGAFAKTYPIIRPSNLRKEEEAMSRPTTLRASRSTIVLNKVKTFFSKPHNVILLLLGIVLTFTTVAPIVAIVEDTFKIHAGTIDAHLTGQATGYTTVNYTDLFTSRMAKTNLWTPLLNTVLLAVGTCVVSILYGGLFAFLITRTDLAWRKYLSSIFIFPYIMPQWTLAVVWQNLFNSNAVTGTSNGLLAALFGVNMPIWWCKGLFPSLMVLGLHYAPFAYILIGGIFRNMDANLEEAATILDTPKWKTMFRITLPMVKPAILSTILLVFGSAMGSYPVPHYLGLSTLSTKYVSMNSKYTGEASILAIIMMVFGVAIMLLNQLSLRSRKNYTTVTGKSGQISKITLGKTGRVVIALILVILTFFTSIFPIISFAFETFLPNPGDYSFLYTGDASNLTTKWWVTAENVTENGMYGQKGILYNETIWRAFKGTILVSVACALLAGSIGTMIGYAVSKNRRSRWANYVNSVAFLPYLMPSIAVGVAFFILFSTEKLNLFNTYTLLIIVGTVKYIPFASRSSLNSMLQLSGEIEEAAIIQDVPWIKRMTRIIIPIQKSSIISGFLLPFMTCLRELSLFMLLCVQGFILSTTLDYFDEMGLYAFSSGINLILIVTILVCNTLVNKITGASLDKGIGG